MRNNPSDSYQQFDGMTDMTAYAKRRKAWNRGMGPAAVKEYEQLVRQRARQLVDCLEDRQGELFINSWINAYMCVYF